VRSTAAEAPGEAARPAEPKTAARKVISAVGTAERTWRKTLSFAFVALVVVAAVVSGLAIFGVMTGLFPVQVGSETLTGAGGALLGAVGIAVAFAAVVLVLAIVAAIIYGLGWLLAGLAIFIPMVVLIATLPATAPFILIGLLIWWLVRRRKGPFEPNPAPKVEPVMQTPPPATQSPPPLPRDGPPAG
jgi:predicted cobalt transporter CbtA